MRSMWRMPREPTATATRAPGATSDRIAGFASSAVTAAAASASCGASKVCRTRYIRGRGMERASSVRTGMGEPAIAAPRLHDPRRGVDERAECELGDQDRHDAPDRRAALCARSDRAALDRSAQCAVARRVLQGTVKPGGVARARLRAAIKAASPVPPRPSGRGAPASARASPSPSRPRSSSTICWCSLTAAFHLPTSRLERKRRFWMRRLSLCAISSSTALREAARIASWTTRLSR